MADEYSVCRYRSEGRPSQSDLPRKHCAEVWDHGQFDERRKLVVKYRKVKNLRRVEVNVKKTEHSGSGGGDVDYYW